MLFMYKLKPIQRQMLKNKQLVISFQYKYNGETLKILLYNLEQNILAITKEGHKEYISLLINKDCSIETEMEHDEYKILIKLLGIKYSKKNPFSPANFFFDLAQNIPEYKTFSEENIHMCKYFVYKYIDDAHKTSFLRFVNNGDKNKVSTKNLNKTAIYFGKEKAENCKKYNISSAWTTKEKTN